MTRQLQGAQLARVLGEALPGSVASWCGSDLWIHPEALEPVCHWLKETPDMSFDFLSSVSAVDYIEYFELVYHLTSITHNHCTVIKTRVFGRERPTIPSLVPLWRGAELQEREIWDLMGIVFTGHPNLKRIMLWEGFEGHPHRKDHLG